MMHDVVIIGAGPAGLAAAIELRRHSLSVLILERESEAGGIPRHCAHPPYGLREYGRIMTGPAYARRNVERAIAAGVELRTGATAVSRTGGGIAITTGQGVAEIAGRRVLLCLGARETPRSARLIGGARPLGVLNTGALQAAVNLKQLRPFSRPLIVGTELVSLSAILTCRHAGIRPVAMIEARADPIARWPLNLFPRAAGIPLHFNTELIAIEGAGRVDAAEIRTQGTTRRIACDGILLTGGFTPEAALARSFGLAIDAGTGGPVTDCFGRCSDKTVFAAGNLLRPVETAGWCYREGQRIAGFIAQDLARELPGAPVQVSALPPLRYALPQNLLPGRRSQLQLRAGKRITGRLVARQAGQVIASRHGTFLPERRILLELNPHGPAAVEIQIEQDPA